ncbi:uncharacterized protein BDZ99DRAFT_463207 [Mytilinidion resinicola]|uniref:Glycosyl transferase CAP10 domain-containing protein n=1 Tax=Mytilinidion resinicola TaxID=574789 RepID=A0A6A6YN40_9PEZI|nr:uncharacterized protein BDZ99DRAFT_463207 [Mytilinidion resinicola]KAF2809385.1 hypothetical protein BDZ99DRAFT_463207 [Mytilinidion resinicola]
MKSPDHAISSWRFLQFLAFASAIVTLTGLTWFFGGGSTHFSLSKPSLPHLPTETSGHPIDRLIASAEESFQDTLARQTKSLNEAAAVYRTRRGRHPPPGFDAWYKFATDRDAVLVEDFFDRIYDDLGPFWGIDPRRIRKQAHAAEQVVMIRNFTTSQKTDTDRPWMNLWEDLIKTVAHSLPDVDIPINVMDESRLLVPWETINEYMSDAHKTMLPVEAVVGEYQGMEHFRDNTTFDWQWLGPRVTEPASSQGPRSYWSLVRPACPPDSPVRNTPLFQDIWTKEYHPKPEHAAAQLLHLTFPGSSHRGYVQNWTEATDPCQHPHLQGLHGNFVEPLSMKTSQKLFPLFGGSKLPMNNEILLPAAMYWSDDPLYSGGDSNGGDWGSKNNSIMWRGAATGGRNRKETWQRFHRHRFVSMLNGSQVAAAELTLNQLADNVAGIGPGGNMRLAPSNPYNLHHQTSGTLGSYMADLTDASFYDLLCSPADADYDREFYAVTKRVPMADMYEYKYLPDIDGNSFSGRYRGFLRSSSLPIKATVYAEWHDSRLMPWVHFVPMDNTFIDFYGIVEYFLGEEPDLSRPEEPTPSEAPGPESSVSSDGGEKKPDGEERKKAEKRRPPIIQNKKNGHDAAAKKIALAGQEWAEKVLRREDMQIYVFRLLLEYARVCDERRERLGWVQDLKKG